VLRSQSRTRPVHHLSERPSQARTTRKPARLLSCVVLGVAAVTGTASLALFALFLSGWYVGGIRTTTAPALLWDSGLSLAFFLQHSGMVRRPFRSRLAAFVPRRYLGALYAIASGLVLTAVVLLWQRSNTLVFVLEGPWRWAARACSLAALVVFYRSIRALRSFDPFGLDEIRASLRGRSDGPPVPFVVVGPYRWVRHPLYSCMLVLVWSCPFVTTDRLLFDVLWTAWIWLGAKLEERDLVDEFGDAYRRYRSKVSMLVPWRGATDQRAERRTTAP
jgi:methanethiol S-methyltransferase